MQAPRKRILVAGAGLGGLTAALSLLDRGYDVQVSMDGKTWGAPVAQGQGTGTPTIITFKPVQAKFVRVTQTGKATDTASWSVLNFRVFAAPGTPSR